MNISHWEDGTPFIILQTSKEETVCWTPTKDELKTIRTFFGLKGE